MQFGETRANDDKVFSFGSTFSLNGHCSICVTAYLMKCEQNDKF